MLRKRATIFWCPLNAVHTRFPNLFLFYITKTCYFLILVLQIRLQRTILLKNCPLKHSLDICFVFCNEKQKLRQLSVVKLQLVYFMLKCLFYRCVLCQLDSDLRSFETLLYPIDKPVKWVFQQHLLLEFTLYSLFYAVLLWRMRCWTGFNEVWYIFHSEIFCRNFFTDLFGKNCWKLQKIRIAR